MTELTQVYATDAEDGVPPSFELIEAADYWEVPIEGHGPPENPVPGEPGPRPLGGPHTPVNTSNARSSDCPSFYVMCNVT